MLGMIEKGSNHQMLKQKNRLSLALMLQTHLEEVDRQLFSRKKLFEPKNARKAKLSEINETCFVCEKVEWGMERLMRTFLLSLKYWIIFSQLVPLPETNIATFVISY